MDGSALVIFLGAAGLAGFVAGLTGLGTSLTALVFWLHVTTPQVAVPMAAAAAVVSHIVTLTFIRQGIVWRRLWPFLLGGLIGLPIGVAGLSLVGETTAKIGLGLFLMIYCGYGLFVKRPPVIRAGGRKLDGAVGLGGGLFGGLISASGPLPTIWAGLRGWPKDEQRGVFQPFNLVILGLAVAGHGINDRFDAIDAGTALATFALSAAGAGLGLWTYRRTSERRFGKLVMLFLLLAGVSHLAGALFN